MSTFLGLLILVMNQIQQCKQTNTRIEFKNMKNEYTVQIGFVLGPVTD